MELHDLGSDPRSQPLHLKYIRRDRLCGTAASIPRATLANAMYGEFSAPGVVLLREQIHAIVAMMSTSGADASRPLVTRHEVSTE